MQNPHYLLCLVLLVIALCGFKEIAFLSNFSLFNKLKYSQKNILKKYLFLNEIFWVKKYKTTYVLYCWELFNNWKRYYAKRKPITI